MSGARLEAQLDLVVLEQWSWSKFCQSIIRLPGPDIRNESRLRQVRECFCEILRYQYFIWKTHVHIERDPRFTGPGAGHLKHDRRHRNRIAVMQVAGLGQSVVREVHAPCLARTLGLAAERVRCISKGLVMEGQVRVRRFETHALILHKLLPHRVSACALPGLGAGRGTCYESLATGGLHRRREGKVTSLQTYEEIEKATISCISANVLALGYALDIIDRMRIVHVQRLVDHSLLQT
mmetsp:Transcript_20494/g.32680  ORF Transcript_20494/g.32680 Transcript_20494/m.32680 type:complete len:237 (-) Transcript_20494:140-850(-)